MTIALGLRQLPLAGLKHKKAVLVARTAFCDVVGAYAALVSILFASNRKFLIISSRSAWLA